MKLKECGIEGEEHIDGKYGLDTAVDRRVCAVIHRLHEGISEAGPDRLSLRRTEKRFKIVVFRCGRFSDVLSEAMRRDARRGVVGPEEDVVRVNSRGVRRARRSADLFGAIDSTIIGSSYPLHLRAR